MAGEENLTRYVRFESAGQVSYGVMQGDSIERLDRCFLDGAKRTGEKVAVDQVRLLIPIEPERVSKIVGANGNYQLAGAESVSIPHPPVFVKFATSLVTDGDDVELPSELATPYLGASLVVVIGKEGRNIPLQSAQEHIFGVAAGNDVSDADSWGRGRGDFVPDRMLSKASDTWAPIGSQIVAGIDYSDLSIEAKINGELVVSSRTSQMINDVASLIHYLSHYFTLLPGDLIFTGEPLPAAGPPSIRPGDEMEIEIEGLGKLRNACTDLKQGGGRHWWHDLEDQLAAEQAAVEPQSAS